METIHVQERLLERLLSTMLRAMTFWLAITAVLTGYIVVQAERIEPVVRVRLLELEILLSFATWTLFCIMAPGLVRIASNLDTTLRRIDEEAYARANIGVVFRTFRRTFWAAFWITVTGATAVIAGLFYLRSSILR